MRPRFMPFIASAAIIATSACALAFSAPTTALDNVPSAVYEIEPTHTSVLFGISHLGFSNYHGRFNTVSGELNFDTKAPEKSSVKITIAIDSIDTNHAELEGKLKGADWFDTAKFPTASFTSTKVEKLTDTSGKVMGDLTLHGVTKPVTLDVTFNGAGENPFSKKPMLGFSARTAIKRSDFGISQYIPMVGDDVTLLIEAEMQKKQ
jgi:polyisoprenoid-binding protein YceI